MRICPDCGHADPPCWRSRMYHLYTDFCKLGELKFWNPNLTKELEQSEELRPMGTIRQRIVGTTKFKRIPCFGKFYTDGTYNYGLKLEGLEDNNTVIRIARIDAREPNSLKEPQKETGHKNKC